MELDALRERIEALNGKLLPIANSPIPFGADFTKYEMPKDPDANQTLAEAVELYARSSADERLKIREIFQRNHAFAWAAVLLFPAIPGTIPPASHPFRNHRSGPRLARRAPTDARSAAIAVRGA